MRLNLIATTTAALLFGTPFAIAQDGEAIRGFLTDAALLGADVADVGEITEDGDTVVARDVAMRWQVTLETPEGVGTITMNADIPTLTVEGLEASGEGHSAALIDMPTIELEIVATGPEIDGASYDVTVTDMRFVDASWGAFPRITADPMRPASRFGPLITWYAGLSYQENFVGRFAADANIAGERQEIAYGPFSFGPLVDGKVEEFSYGPITQTQTMPVETSSGTQMMSVEVEYGEIRGSGLDVRPIASLFTGAVADGGPETAMASLTLDGASAQFGDSGSFSIGSVEIVDFSVDTSRGGLLARLDPVLVSLMSGGTPDPMASIEMVVEIYGAFGFERYAFSDIEMSVEEDEFEGRAAEMAVEGVGAGAIERIAVTGLEGTGPDDGRFSLGSLVLRDFVFPSRDTIMSFARSAAAGNGPPAGVEAMAIAPTFGGFSLEALSFSGAGLTAPLEIGEAVVGLSNYVLTTPTEIDITLRDFQMPAALVPDPNTQQMLTAMNADPLRAEGEIMLRWDEDTRRVELQKDVSADNLGRVQAEAMVSGIPREVFTNPAAVTEALATASFNNISATFTNRGVADFFINMMSQQSGVAQEEFAQAMATQAQLQIGMLTGSQELAAEVAGAVRTFLSEPDTLSISASPASPVPFAELIGTAITAPNALVGLLNLSISANE